MSKAKRQKKNNENMSYQQMGEKNYQVVGHNLSTATCFNYQVVVHSWKTKKGVCASVAMFMEQKKITYLNIRFPF